LLDYSFQPLPTGAGWRCQPGHPAPRRS
jgi:hypothetical protein